MSGPVTIGDLRRDRRLLWVYCRECGRERDVDPSTLPLPGAHPVPEVGNRMVGNRKITDRPRPAALADRPETIRRGEVRRVPRARTCRET